jgi:hypothetical protein
MYCRGSGGCQARVRFVAFLQGRLRLPWIPGRLGLQARKRLSPLRIGRDTRLRPPVEPARRSAGTGLWISLTGCGGQTRRVCGLTFELTPTAEAATVSPGCDDSTTGAARAYSGCRSGSGVERGVRRHPALPTRRVSQAQATRSSVWPPIESQPNGITSRSPPGSG